MEVKAYAKLNLILKVVGRLENGYHDLEMINSKIDYFDIVDVEKSNFDEFYIDADVCPIEDNLAYKAMNILRNEFDISSKYKISINKKIPAKGGLAGGSADAAAVIKCIIELENLKLGNDKLIEIAKKVGADVPYCLSNSKCFVSGIGDVVEPISSVINDKNYLLILCFPPFGFDTKTVFEEYDKIDCGLNDRLRIDNLFNLESNFINDLEKVVIKLRPDYKINQIKEVCKKNGAIACQMAGSGSTIYALFNEDEKEKLDKCFKELNTKFEDYKFEKSKTISC